MRAVDTNVLVRILVRDDPEQAAIADAYVARGAWVSHLVLLEAVWVFESSYEFSRAKVGEALALILQHKDLTIEDSKVVETALGIFRANRKVELADCLVLASARKAGHLPMGTFDRNFAALDDVERLG